MNVVCLMGWLAAEQRLAVPRRPGWRSAVLDVSRQASEGHAEPGVVPVALLIPPRLAARKLASLRPGEAVAVLGMLEVEVDYSSETPRAYHAVIAEQIEAVRDFSSPGPLATGK